MRLIRNATRAASRALSFDATWTVPAKPQEGLGGGIRQTELPIPGKGHWTGYTERIAASGLPEGMRYAHFTQNTDYLNGVQVWALRGERDTYATPEDRQPMGTLTIKGPNGAESMVVLEVAQSPFQGVYYLAGE
ncbi:MAG: hypothetical protein AAFY19_00670 [Pseudomonadota bacterium]